VASDIGRHRPNFGDYETPCGGEVASVSALRVVSAPVPSTIKGALA
jgi:hypothetical protein